MKRLVTLIAGMLLPASAAFAAGDCIDDLTAMLRELAVRHEATAVRSRAENAQESVPAACREAPDLIAAAERILAGLEDPAVRVMDAAHFERTLVEWTGGRVTGVGLTELLSIDVDEHTGLLTVIAPVPGSPAADAGLRAGDVVVSIEGAATKSLGLTHSMQRLRVAAGEEVDLRILRDDHVHELRLQAVELSALDPVVVKQLEADGRDLLHVHLQQFVPGAGEKLRSAIGEASDVDAIVLDLRDNPGGLVDELQRAAGLFLAPGTSIARITGPEPAVLSVAADAAPVETPLYVIIGSGSASAAEALAGALQAHRRATVYGQRSFGKGLVHQTLPVAGDPILMFPSGQLETPTGQRILRDGIVPDVRTTNPLTVIGSDLGKSLIRQSADR